MKEVTAPFFLKGIVCMAPSACVPKVPATQEKTVPEEPACSGQTTVNVAATVMREKVDEDTLLGQFLG